MTIESFLMFLVAGIALNLTPGPDMLYVITRTAANGRAAGIVSALGISTGCLFHVAATALGLSALLLVSATAYTAVKWIGGLYLIYMGIQTLRTAWKSSSFVTPDSTSPATPARSLRSLFQQGVLINVFNPKVALFFLAFLPQFAHPADPGGTWRIILLGLAFITTGTIVNVLVAIGTSKARHSICGVRGGKTMNYISGTVFCLMGGALAASE